MGQADQSLAIGQGYGLGRASARFRALTSLDAVTLVTGLAAWVLTHPNTGWANDEMLYAFLALNWADPQNFGTDLFVRYGSQDAFSIFSPIYGWTAQRLGLQAAMLTLTWIAYGLWIAAAWMLSRRLLKGLAAKAAFLAMCSWPAFYGGWTVLFAGEDFLTSRPYAEALVMMGLAALMGRRRVLAAVLLLAAMAFHPLMGLAGACAAWVHLCLRRPALLALLPAAVAVALALAMAGVTPFDRLFLVMDTAWLEGVRLRNGFVLPSQWIPNDWARLASQAAILTAAALVSKGWRSRFFVAVMVVGAAGVLAALIGGDLMRSALMIQLQTWRLTWLMALMVLPALALLVARLRRRRGGGLAILLAVLAVAMTPGTFEGWRALLPASVGLAALAASQLAYRGRLQLPPPLDRALVFACALTLALWVVARTPDRLAVIGYWLAEERSLRGSLAAFPFTGLVFASALGLVWFARKRPGVAFAGAAAVLATGVAFWDQRLAWDRYVYSGAALPITAHMPEGAGVVWGRTAKNAWLLLRRPAYVSHTQASGLLFSRPTTVEWMHRVEQTQGMVPAAAWGHSDSIPTCAETHVQPPRATIRAVCEQAGGALGGFVLARPVPGAIAFDLPQAEPNRCLADGKLVTERVTRLFFASCNPAPESAR